MLKLIGGDDLLARGVEIAQLRPVFTQNMEQKLAEGYAVNATLRKDEWERSMLASMTSCVSASRSSMTCARMAW
jgi:hypothetical protein